MNGARFYSAFGMRICADSAIPGLSETEPQPGADTTIWLRARSPATVDGGVDWYRGPMDELRRPSVLVRELMGGRIIRWRYSDGTEFDVDRQGASVWARWPDSSTLEDTVTYLLGPILAFVLRLRGVTSLHASAVAAGGRAVALVGPPSAGKSTTAVAFARMGHAVLADDVLPLAERGDTLYVLPSYPQVRLWPDSVAMLYGAADALPPLTPTWDKRCLSLTGGPERFEVNALPLAAVYLLGERSTGTAAPAVQEVRRAQALLALVANSSVNYAIDAEMRRREFAALGRLVTTVPVRRIVPSADPARLPLLCRRILDDIRAA